MKNMKRYWIWNPITHKIIINKDVTFDETLLLSIHKQYRKEKNISEDTSKVVQVDVNVVESSNNEKKKKISNLDGEPNIDKVPKDKSQFYRLQKICRLLERHWFAYIAAFVLITNNGKSSNFQEAIKNKKHHRSKIAMERI